MNHDSLIALINDVLDYDRAQRGHTSDVTYGKEIGVPQATISRWRHGHIGKSARVLLPRTCQYCRTQTQTQAEPT